MSAALLSRWSVSSFSRLILVCATALVVPGSHVWEKAERDKFFGTNLGHDSPLVAQAVMPKGACLVYASSTLHAGGDIGVGGGDDGSMNAQFDLSSSPHAALASRVHSPMWMTVLSGCTDHVSTWSLRAQSLVSVLEPCSFARVHPPTVRAEWWWGSPRRRPCPLVAAA